MKKVLLFLLLLTGTISFGQRTNLDRERFHVSLVNLPSEPIVDNSQRTYSINLGGVSVSGFTRVKAPGNIDVKFTSSGTTISDARIDKTKHEKKKDGKVVSVSYTYVAKATYKSTYTINVINALTGKSYEKSFVESSKYSSNSFDSNYKAEKHYKNNKYDLRSNYRIKHKKAVKSRIKSFLNSRYGYVPYSTKNEVFWILASKKHPEYAMHNEAYTKAKNAFAKMKYDEPTDELAKELEPVIEYFKSVIPKYPGTKRKMRKIKYASYYNLANIYYYLDMPDKVQEYGQKIIDNDYDKSDGRRFLRYAESLKESMEKNNMKSRHMKVVTEDLSNVEDEKEETETEQVKESPKLELSKAYLITKKNDTILVEIKKKDIWKIGYDVATVAYDNDGTLIGTKVRKANLCKEILFVDGLHFKNIKFKESSTKSGSADVGQLVLGGATDKLCQVIYESDKIGLYKFNDKELVLVPNGSEKGKSTQSVSFVFGFRKQLAKMAKSCPTVAAKAKKKEYKNNEKSLIKFCEDLTDCKE
ncbi:hypothetical protein [Tenacibaculum sp. 190524A05c]|uniref:Uncharacterized protein n=1 Tax=Tenacibaculum platacis TaxID=3137852 RepID=A0ABM9NTF9_9FLAO